MKSPQRERSSQKAGDTPRRLLEARSLEAVARWSAQRVDGFIDFESQLGLSLATEYEQLLTQILNERKAKLEAEKSKGMDKKKIDALVADIGFVEVELERYRRGLNLFRTKGPLPKVGRWGKAEAGQPSEAAP